MKIKFNKFERVAGLFVGFAVFSGIALMFSVAIKQGWLEQKVNYVTAFENAEGVHPGTMVQISGLKAGSVDDVELQNDNKIRVHFHIFKKFNHRVKQDSIAQLVRPFIIGERVLDLSPGAEKSSPIAEGTFIPSHEAVDMMSLMSGKKLGPYLESITDMVENLRVLAEAFLSKDRTQSIVKIFDKIDPLLKNVNMLSVEVIKLAQQANKNENLGVLLGNLAITTEQLNSMLPEIQDKAPAVARDLTSIVENMAVLTKEMKVFLPALAEIAPDLPHASRRAIEALDEAVVLLKAMKKSMFLKGNVDDVKEEEQAAAEEKRRNRRPAAQAPVAPQSNYVPSVPTNTKAAEQYSTPAAPAISPADEPLVPNKFDGDEKPFEM